MLNCPKDEESIYALASGLGPAAIAIIRITGRDCVEQINDCIKIKNGHITDLANKLKLVNFISPKTQEVSCGCIAVDMHLQQYFQMRSCLVH